MTPRLQSWLLGFTATACILIDSLLHATVAVVFAVTAILLLLPSRGT